MITPSPDDRVKRHYQWRKRVSAHLPNLSLRVFALRDKSYMGYGFHYDLERQLGKLIAMVNDYNKYLTIADTVIDQVIFDAFLRQLLRAEFSAKGIDFPYIQKVGKENGRTFSNGNSGKADSK